jgi:serine/threonine protein kinase
MNDKSFINPTPYLFDECEDSLWPSVREPYEKFMSKIASNVWKSTVTKLNGVVCDVMIRVIKLEQSSINTRKIMDAVQNLRLNHVGILKVHKVFLDGVTLWVIQDLTGFEMSYHSLDSILEQGYPEGLPEKVIAAILQQVLVIINFIHKANIVWCDVRGSNILIRTDGSILVNLLSLRSVVQLKTRDSLPFVAPELLQKDRDGENSDVNQKFKVDIWSLGIMALQMATGRVPYSGLSIPDITQRILHTRPEIKEKLQENFKSFLNLCFDTDPARRPSAEILLCHDFLKELDADIASIVPSQQRKSFDGDHGLDIEALNERPHDPYPQSQQNRPIPTEPPAVFPQTQPVRSPRAAQSPRPLTFIEHKEPSPRVRRDPSDSDFSLRNIPVSGSPHSNLPIETHLAETNSQYFIFIRAIPGTTITVFISEGRTVLIRGKLPDLEIVPGIRMVDRVHKTFERKIHLPKYVLNQCKMNINKETLTATVIIDKFETLDLGTENF